eukprot:2190264-Alexandrium_andersonii.AAC.1
MDEPDYGPLEDVPPDTPAASTGAPAPSPGADAQGDVNMQQGQAGRAQRCGRKLALQVAWQKERQEQQWWAARPW